ncbi:FAD-dependent monooxygenase [Halorussus aquaticus]|uniref:FAD-dependent monooxygenase n=1 Tax=Halorussus aquaticus TaxID=2953748 RepID=A0ABD5Q6A7_9EURY|nr:FAD-dependent monooxygenase [Halorussus aquaticus]
MSPAAERPNVTVAIVGGGIGGLCAGIALRQRGFDPTIYEATDELRPVGSGIVLRANAMQVLDRLGVADEVADRGVEIGSVRMFDARGRTLMDLDLGYERERFGHGYVYVHRAALQRALVERLSDGPLRLGKECTGVTQSDDEVTLSFADGTEASAPAVVGADGIGSTVRGELFPDASPRPTGVVCYRGVAETTLPASFRETGWQVWGQGTRVGGAAVDDDRVYWFATFGDPLGDPERPEQLLAALADRYRSYPDPVPAVVAATDPDDLVVTELADVPPLATWRDRRVALLGDAAHAPLPYLGQGAGQALEDALALARAFDARGNPRAAFRAYEAARKEKSDRVVAESRRHARAAQLEHRWACWLRNRLFGLVPERATRRQRAAIATLSV